MTAKKNSKYLEILRKFVCSVNNFGKFNFKLHGKSLLSDLKTLKVIQRNRRILSREIIDYPRNLRGIDRRIKKKIIAICKSVKLEIQRLIITFVKDSLLLTALIVIIYTFTFPRAAPTCFVQEIHNQKVVQNSCSHMCVNTRHIVQTTTTSSQLHYNCVI